LCSIWRYDKYNKYNNDIQRHREKTGEQPRPLIVSWEILKIFLEELTSRRYIIPQIWQVIARYKPTIASVKDILLHELHVYINKSVRCSHKIKTVRYYL
jgi:hypothetical protein